MRVEFPEQIECKLLRGKREEIELTEDFDAVYDDIVYITAMKGFRCDGSSVPRVFWNIISPLGKSKEAGVIHDWGYKMQFEGRKLTDLRFYYGLRELNLDLWKCKVMYRAVRVFGGWTWQKHKRRNRKGLVD